MKKVNGLYKKLMKVVQKEQKIGFWTEEYL